MAKKHFKCFALYLVILTAFKWFRAYVNQISLSAESDDKVRSCAIFSCSEPWTLKKKFRFFLLIQQFYVAKCMIPRVLNQIDSTLLR